MKCELCQCEIDKLTVHHLIPKSRAKNKYKAIKDDDSNIIWICRQCHDQLHSLWNESTLRDLYNTKEKILSSPDMKKFISWRQKHPDYAGHSKMSNKRKHK